MDSRGSSPTPPNSPVSDLAYSNPNSPFSRDSMSSEETQPQLGFGYTFTSRDSKIIFEIGGRRDLVAKHAREIIFHHLRGTNVTAEQSSSTNTRVNMPKDWLKFTFQIDNNDISILAVMFWYLGKVTDNFREPQELLSSYTQLNSPVFIRPRSPDHHEQPPKEMLAITLSRAAEEALARQHEPLQMHFTTLADLLEARIDQTYWTQEEIVEHKLVPKHNPSADSSPVSDNSWAVFFHRVPGALQSIFAAENNGSTDDEFEFPVPNEEQPDYESSNSNWFKLI